ncbi:MAG TPA: GAF domain-containing sensor histidine kinase [Gaiellaceae bacterium]
MARAELSTELRIVHDLARVVATGPYHVDEIVDRICAEIRNAFGFERALLVRYDPDDRTVFAVVQQGVDWPGDQWLMLDKFPFLVAALDGGRAVFVEDARAAAAIPSKIIERFGVHSIVAVPLMVEGDCLGFIVGDRKGGGGAFELSEGELSFLTTLGAVAAVFIAKAEQYEALQRALEGLQRLDRVKSDFVSIASHELRNPISVVHGIAATMYARGDDVPTGQLEELRKALYDTTARLRGLAEQLLDLSQLDAGMLYLKPRRFKARECLERLAAELVPDRASEVEIEIEPSLELTCDLHAFERIVSNLLINALTYGRPPVIVRALRDGATRIAIEDQGEGVDPTFAPQLFDRFTRSKASRRTHQGAGLGLSIARSYARSLGGDLLYEAAEPAGARFTLVLPR